MFAFLRVVVFYLGFAALLTWAMFALGWADALELPGFEGTRAPAPPAPTTVSSVPLPEPAPQPAKPRDVRPAESQVQFKPEPKPEPKPELKPEPKRVVVDTPPTPVRTEVAVAPPVVEAPRAPEPLRVAPPPPPLPSPPPPLFKEAKAPEPVAAPVVPQPRPPVVAQPPVQSPPRTVDATPVSPPAPPSPPRAPVAAPTSAEPIAKAWAPGHRIAGFGPDALVDLLGETRRARDDVACVMFRNVVFKAGTTVYQPRALAELDLVAKVLIENPGQRVELGSRLGPGRPMATDAKLRTDRSSLVRENLIARGVAPSRLVIDTNEAYERVAEDVGRVNGGRAQSIGVCLHAS